jgi:hypothetical protein
VVKWTLGHIVMVKLVVLSVSYLVFNFVHVLLKEISDLGTYKQADRWATIGVMVPRAFLETCFFYWVMLSLIRMIAWCCLFFKYLYFPMVVRLLTN